MAPARQHVLVALLPGPTWYQNNRCAFKQPQRLQVSQLMSPVGQGTKCVLAAQVYLSISLVGVTRVISFLLLPSSLWSALVEADTGSLHSILFHDAIQLALAGCKFSWAAQVLQCFSALDEPLPLVADAPIAIDNGLLRELFLRDRLASFDS